MYQLDFWYRITWDGSIFIAKYVGGMHKGTAAGGYMFCPLDNKDENIGSYLVCTDPDNINCLECFGETVPDDIKIQYLLEA